MFPSTVKLLSLFQHDRRKESSLSGQQILGYSHFKPLGAASGGGGACDNEKGGKSGKTKAAKANAEKEDEEDQAEGRGEKKDKKSKKKKAATVLAKTTGGGDSKTRGSGAKGVEAEQQCRRFGTFVKIPIAIGRGKERLWLGKIIAEGLINGEPHFSVRFEEDEEAFDYSVKTVHL